MAQQMSFFGSAPRAFCDDERGTIVYYPALLRADESQPLFRHLEATLPWAEETMWMYDRTVDVPRLIARFPDKKDLPPELREVQTRVEAFLGERFTSVSVQYYRGANDSVAWHNDHRDEMVDLPTIALVSLGATREMQIRSKAVPRQTFSVDLDAGSLIVMSGRSQEFWEHTIPKSKRAVGPRISIALRQRRLP